MGHRRSKPRSVKRHWSGAHTYHCILRPDPQHGKTQAQGPSSLTRSSGDLAFTAGTLCRGARGLSSELGMRGARARTLSVCLLRNVSRRCPTCLLGCARASASSCAVERKSCVRDDGHVLVEREHTPSASLCRSHIGGGGGGAHTDTDCQDPGFTVSEWCLN